MLKPGKLILVVCGYFVEIPYSEIHIIPNVWLTRLRKVFKSSVFVKMEEMVKCLVVPLFSVF